MSKIIEESIGKILGSNDTPEKKTEELIELKYTSADANKIEDAIIQLFREQFSVELTHTDIDSEVQQISFQNEGIASIHDEKIVSNISKKREELLADLKGKLEAYKKTKKIVIVEESKENEVETVPEESKEESLEDLEATLKEPKPLEQENIVDLNNFVNPEFNNSAVSNYDYRPVNLELYRGTEEPSPDDFIETQLRALDRESAALAAQAKSIREKHDTLIYIRKEGARLIRARDEKIHDLRANTARQEQEIRDACNKELTELYSGLNATESYYSQETSSFRRAA